VPSPAGKRPGIEPNADGGDRNRPIFNKDVCTVNGSFLTIKQLIQQKTRKERKKERRKKREKKVPPIREAGRAQV